MKVTAQRPNVYETQPDPRRVLMTAALEPWPDNDWIERWRRDRQFPVDLHSPWIAEGVLWFEVDRNEDIPRMWSAIKARIEATNRAYESEVKPAKEEAARREKERADAKKHRLEEARRIVAGLK